VAVAPPPAEVVAADAVTENEIDPDRDIGLLESLRPQTIQEVSAPDLLQNEVDPDRDIGLLESLRPQTIQEVRTIDQLPSSSALKPDRSVARRLAAVAEGRTHPLLGGR
jgi:hypothetical protein